MTDKLTSRNRERLKSVSAATLTTVLLKHGLRNQFMQNVHRIGNSGPNMVGEAYTLRYIPAREDLDKLDGFRNPEHPQRKAVENCPAGHVLVIDSRKDARAASAGGILITRMMKRGVAGVVTDGGFRDAPEVADLDMPAYHQRPAAPTNLTLHHACDIDLPIGCGDVPVYPRDIVVGDLEGVVVIPAHLANEAAEEAFEMTAFEDFVTEEVRNGTPTVGLYPPTKEESLKRFDAWRKANRR